MMLFRLINSCDCLIYHVSIIIIYITFILWFQFKPNISSSSSSSVTSRPMAHWLLCKLHHSFDENFRLMQCVLSRCLKQLTDGADTTKSAILNTSGNAGETRERFGRGRRHAVTRLRPRTMFDLCRAVNCWCGTPTLFTEFWSVITVSGPGYDPSDAKQKY